MNNEKSSLIGLNTLALSIEPKSTKMYAVLLGITSTMPVIGFHLGGFYIALSSIIMICCAAYWLIKTDINCLRINPAAIFLLWCVLSSLYGFAFFAARPDFIATIKSYLTKIIIYIVMAILVTGPKEESAICGSIVKGIVIGCYINCIWSIFDAVIYYSVGQSLTNTIFANYITSHSIRYGQLSLIRNGTIRSGGLNGDPANIGLFACVIALYWFASRGKLISLFVSIGALFASSSVTGLISTILGIGLFSIAQKKQRINSYYVIGVLLIAMLMWLFPSQVRSISGALFDRLSSKFTSGVGDSIRLEYYLQTIPAALKASPLRLLIGTGFGTSSYSFFTTDSLIISSIEEFRPYDPESVYISYLFDVGLIGLTSYIYTLVRSFNILRMSYDKTAQQTNALIVASLFTGLFYHYTLYLPMILLIICSEGIIKEFQVDANPQEDLNIYTFNLEREQ